MGHKTSVSKLKVDENNICISSSYDCTLNIWNLDDTRVSEKMFGPHKNAIVDFEWKNSLCVSGDKDGVVSFWDINGILFVKGFENMYKYVIFVDLLKNDFFGF